MYGQSVAIGLWKTCSVCRPVFKQIILMFGLSRTISFRFHPPRFICLCLSFLSCPCLHHLKMLFIIPLIMSFQFSRAIVYRYSVTYYSHNSIPTKLRIKQCFSTSKEVLSQVCNHYCHLRNMSLQMMSREIQRNKKPNILALITGFLSFILKNGPILLLYVPSVRSSI